MIVNTGILKEPMNWLLVGFSVVLLIFISHLIFKGISQ